MTATWHPLIAESEFPESGALATRVAGWHLLVARTEDGFSALNDRCTHQAAQLSDGKIRRGAIMCPLHGARFEVETGKCIGGAYADLRKFDLRVMDGGIEVLVPDEPPGLHETPQGA